MSLGGLKHSVGLVALLGTHHTLVEEALHTVVRFLCNLQSGLGLLQQLEGALHHLLACTVLGHIVQGGSTILYALCLLHLGFHLRGVDNGQRVASMNEVALADPDLQDTSRHLTRNSVFRNLNLSLNKLWVATQGEEADEGHDDNHCCKAYDGIQNVMMLFFCLITHI